MARKIFPNAPEIDRRQLIVLTAVTAASGVAGGIESVAAEPVEAVTAMGSPAPEILDWKFCAVTVRRLAEIAQRNRIRQEAGLPLLSIPKELRRMKEVADAEEFSRFAAQHREAVRNEVLKPIREAKGDPHWRPGSFIEGVGLQARVLEILRERLDGRQLVEPPT